MFRVHILACYGVGAVYVGFNHVGMFSPPTWVGPGAKLGIAVQSRFGLPGSDSILLSRCWTSERI